jgi:outer membrane protein OmpA-like peptidoglycan-associated protein
MPLRSLKSLCAASLAIALLVPSLAEAQLGRLGRRIIRTATDETGRQIDELVRNGVRCVFDDLSCIESAEKGGKTAVLTDRDGNLMMDDEGRPLTDPAAAAAQAGPAPLTRPGEGAWANYDFIPGERVLFADDFSGDTVGDFPRRLSLVSGNWEVVEWEGRRLLRTVSSNWPAIDVELPEVLPDKFTIEMDVHTPHGNMVLLVSTEENARQPAGNIFQVSQSRTGVAAGRVSKVESSSSVPLPLREGLTPIRIMVDGRHAKVYLNEQRVANVPSGQFERGQKLRFQVRSAYPDSPFLLGNLRVAAGGRDLYDALEADGRVSTRGIYFATNSDVIRPESTATLKAIGELLREHMYLRLSIEGHTDDVGDDAYNLQLSERRAAAVKAYLVQSWGVTGSRLEVAGLGETRPVADNATAEGKQQNRRVDLVKIGG